MAHAHGLSIGLKNDHDQAGVLFEWILALPAFTFATQISWIFTWSTESTRIVGGLVLFLRILCLLLPAVPFGMLSSAMFQSVGKVFYALIMTLTHPCIYSSLCLVSRRLSWLGITRGMDSDGCRLIDTTDIGVQK